jgi:hypothetical protein
LNGKERRLWKTAHTDSTEIGPQRWNDGRLITHRADNDGGMWGCGLDGAGRLMEGRHDGETVLRRSEHGHTKKVLLQLRISYIGSVMSFKLGNIVSTAVEQIVAVDRYMRDNEECKSAPDQITPKLHKRIL